ncbi:vesicle transport v-SNARE protein [Plasmodium yoelii yoelii]|uniref:Vesicle transport v-SNARE protein n=1 Tax=Plasmodium yoelii yoelii TaxID=73239 RepID=A0AAE9WJY2_PLAYO|nr:vesicle transport v-SNARE protein [Plasmodium yoelii yoelii]
MFLFYLLIFPFDFSILSFDFSIFYFFTTTDLNQIKQITVETNSLPKGSHKIFEQINKYNSDLKKYKNILEKMNGDYYSEVLKIKKTKKKYIQNFIKNSFISYN